ncbi:undecaprenyl-diphosphate phosphatase [Marinomonas fungiae]|uniref:Undecaprenyl-diphosphatase n=1 Tax=Marinomonas fungiae TaxID=1137284 RepID=A0A0K6IPA8_9GAMM|nr:undecaprenyl-diphosphate phosphatase [Marinomonas fungiae]CUB04929.1 Undecaprenyl pyrophosphate phosphatase UppP [Marinomonas fungiae]
MLWYHIVFLALIQGLTEFLPISSSAHLILPSQIVSWPDQGLAFDVAVHVGTLIAVVSYFWRDVYFILKDWSASLLGARATSNSRLGWWVILATIPAVLVGLCFNHFIEANFRSIEVIAYSTIGFGVLLWVSDRFFAHAKDIQQLRLPSVLVIGVAQALALIPGTSRSGVTMTAARFMGFSRDAAARFSFLLSIPIIVAAGSLKSLELLSGQHLLVVDWHSIIWGVVLSALSAYLCIHLFLKWLSQIGFLPFMIYRLALGALLLWLVKVS